MLIKHFAAVSARNQNAPQKAISVEALKALSNYAWPGNVRELEHVIERATILSGEEIGIDDLPAKLRSGSQPTSQTTEMATLEAVERRHILDVLDASNGDKSVTARTLGIDLSTLYRKLKRYELE
jgi:DNA-binding NtrC family response regulator